MEERSLQREVQVGMPEKDVKPSFKMMTSREFNDKVSMVYFGPSYSRVKAMRNW